MNSPQVKPLKEIKIGLVGCGIVGSGVVELLHQHRDLLKERLGIPLVLEKVATLLPAQARAAGLPNSRVTKRWQDLVSDPSISVIVELMGGTREARKLILAALQNGKHVVTANKALLATHGKEIYKEAHRQRLDICFEAAVGGGIPILRALREGFVGNEIKSILGIINGTCNYILSEMSEKGESFEKVLKNAQRLGYAEQDPSFDVEGIDAAHKLSILVSIAYGMDVELKQIHTEGIRSLTPFDIDCARRFGFAIKLLAIAKKNKNGIEARVHPTMIPLSSPLASVREAFNAIYLDGDFVGPSLLYGKGAGKRPTASAVVGDIIEVARNIIKGVSMTVPPLGHYNDSIPKGVIQKMDQLESEYYLRFSVVDQPGVLSHIAGILGKHQISISSVYQHGQGQGKIVPIVILTHRARESNMKLALSKIDRLGSVKNKTLLIRIEKP